MSFVKENAEKYLDAKVEMKILDAGEREMIIK